MKRKNNKIISLVVGSILALLSLSACNGEADRPKTLLPDYSATKEQFEFFAYRPLSDGTYYMDGVECNSGELRTPENYKIYKDAGFTMAFVSAYQGEDWETSDTKREMDMLYQAGVERVLIKDMRIVHDLAKFDTTESVEEYEAYVKECIMTYVNEPNFYGFSLGDEPLWDKAEDYGKIYKAMRNATAELGKPNIYIHMNFLPIDGGSCGDGKYAPLGSFETFEEAYEFYIESFLKATGADRISVDIYFFRGNGLYPGSYANLQILKRLCKQYNAELTFCLQSFNEYSTTRERFATMDESMMRMELETMIGMGLDHFAYFTYCTPEYLSTTGSMNFDGGSFLTRAGKPTNIYYYGKELMEDAKKFQQVVLNYDYRGCKLYTSKVASFNNRPYLSSSEDPSTHTSILFDNSYEFSLLKGVEIDNDVAFVTELKDEENALYMYMVQNAIDPRNAEYGRTDMNVKVDFGKDYKWVAEFNCGELRYVKLNNGIYEKTLSAGYAVYLVPLN